MLAGEGAGRHNGIHAPVRALEGINKLEEGAGLHSAPVQPGAKKVA